MRIEEKIEKYFNETEIRDDEEKDENQEINELEKKEKKDASETIALRVKDIIDDNASKEISKKIKEVLKDYDMSEEEIRDITDDIYSTLFVRTSDKNSLIQTVLRIAKKSFKKL